ncbi:hypothetical protein MMC13_000046 [Lambiella insularis]|nr:hypothetical protein [Lambiella insularis]
MIQENRAAQVCSTTLTTAPKEAVRGEYKVRIMSGSHTPSKMQDSSSGASTPSSDHGSRTPDQLTSRIRVKAMLAGLDEESDDGVSITHTKPYNTNNGSRSSPNHALRSTTGDPAEGIEEHESGEEGNSDIVYPRGKVAARLHGISITHDDTGLSSNEQNGTTTAYERIKQQLLAQKSETAAETLSEEEKPIDLSGIKLTGNILRRKKRPIVVDSDASQSSSKSSLRRSSPRTPSCVPDIRGSMSPSNKGKASSGLFCTPSPTKPSTAPQNTNASDSDCRGDDQAKARLFALVAKKRAEREAKVAAEEQKQAERRSKLTARPVSRALSDDDIEDDSSTENKLTQQARPTRKASKKALEEMNRETQRMSRNMQLAHQAKTKKKITKESLMAKFNFRCNLTPPTSAFQTSNSSGAVSLDPVSDTEEVVANQTPPTSPLKSHDELDSFRKDPPFTVASQELTIFKLQEEDPSAFTAEEELPSVEDIMNRPEPLSDKGKGKAIEHSYLASTNALPKVNKTKFTQPLIRVRPLEAAHRQNRLTFDLDDEELDVVPTRKSRTKRLDVFDKLQPKKATEGRSLQTLRALAHLTSPSKRNDKSRASITLGEMQSSLQKRARQQAARERAEKIQELKDRGYVIQTTEERQRDQVEVEDLLEKARREGEELTKKEKDAAKKERGENGIEEESSDEDGEYKEIEMGVPEPELSGSDEEADDEDQESSDEASRDGEGEAIEEDIEETGSDVGDNNGVHLAGLFETEAAEEEQIDDSLDERETGAEAEDIDESLPVITSKRRRKPNRVLDDEDEEDPIVAASPEKLRNPFAPDLPGSDDAPMGLTQAFEATMADTQTQAYNSIRESGLEQDSLSFLRAMPDPDFPMLETQGPETIVPDSQTGSTSLPQLDLHYSQSQVEHDLLPLATQYSEIPDPTQDAGFGPLPPLRERFVSVPPSTMDTVLLPLAAESEPQVEKKKGRLRRRGSAVRVLSDEEAISDDNNAGLNVGPTGFKLSADAFDVMKKASKKPQIVQSFDKKKSEAKGMVEEQAEESEDEYAGLGGASDDESNAEEDEEVRKMIDEGDVNVDERKLAAFYADKERANDEKFIEKLYKDINNGGLRRKRGIEFDVSDSDDDIETRRRIKRREEARMRKALLENENVGKIAEDPKKLAFLRAIEDREDEAEFDNFLDQPDESFQPVLESQENIDPEAPVSMPEPHPKLKRKRPLENSVPDGANRPPPAARRAQRMKKPADLAELRQHLSFLIDEPHGAVAPPAAESSDSEPEPHAPPHTREPFSARRSTNAIIDRLSLKRAESASTAAGTARLAFHDPNALPVPGFKVPSLLRRATTQVTSEHGITTAGTERAAGGGEKGDFVRRGGSKKCSVNYYARELERNKGLEEGRRRKEEGRRRVGEMRRGVLGVLGAGTFE